VKEATVLYTARSKNGQTGNVPTAWIGRTIEEMRQTCEESGCPYFAGKDIAGSICRCYAWQGHARQALYSIVKAAKRDPARYELENALDKSLRSARIIRFSAVGDASAVGEAEAAEVVRVGRSRDLEVLGYIAGWAQSPWWKGILRASCATKEEMEVALAAGWKVARVAPMDARTRPEPIGIMCPAKMGAQIDCNNCRLCLYTEKSPDVVWFPDHTPLVRAHRVKAAMHAARKAAKESKR